jgi:pyruvate, orthophosphate dikinase
MTTITKPDTSTTPAGKHIYRFEEGSAEMRDLLGGKGANLCEMSRLGLPVPPGFVITTATCREFYERGQQLPDSFWDELRGYLADLEEKAGKKLGDADNPLLISVRSGAKFSMPGMMDTILNLGMNDRSVHGLARQTNNERFAFDAYRRFLALYGKVVLGLDGEAFDALLDHAKERAGVRFDAELSADALRERVEEDKALVERETGAPIPQDPWEQLTGAILAVFRSWNNERAIIYRNRERIPHDLGTACNIVAMVFGNMGEDSGTGVAFTRDPNTGERVFYGEFLRNAQGEDVVAGIRTPQPVARLADEDPAIYAQLTGFGERLEQHYRDMQDIEFTIERGKLYILQCRSGKRTGTAAVRIAVEMANEGLIAKEEAVQRVTPEQLEQLLHPRLKTTGDIKPLARGLDAGPGAAVGHVALDKETAIRMHDMGQDVILVRRTTTPDDLGGMLASKGVLTAEGGRTSHAALVARQYGIPTVCGLGALRIDEEARTISLDGTSFHEGDVITIDGTTGDVYGQALETELPAVSGDFNTLMQWADAARRLRVRANADTPEQARLAVEMGAEGIGLCRTEHMFLGDRLPSVQKAILATDPEVRRAAIFDLLPVQRNDFVGIFQAMADRPVTIRLLDPPMSEFLPDRVAILREMLEMTRHGRDSAEIEEKERLLEAAERHFEVNPMLGTRGVRLSLLIPDFVEMQVEAIIGAACRVKQGGGDPHVEIMIPLVAHVSELTRIKGQLDQVAQRTMRDEGVQVNYSFGTMIEVPRAALTADEIAREASFFSFGTNDLTQGAWMLSRDDAAEYVQFLQKEEMVTIDPTVSIDRTGVGRLMRLCVEDGRAVNPTIKLGICGEHGGEPASVAFCHEIGLDYVSCSPSRVPVARLAAAQAALGSKERDK